MKIGESSRDELAERLRAEGIGLRFGSNEFCLQSGLQSIEPAVRALYAGYPFRQPSDFCDFHVRLDPGIHRCKRMVIASVNGEIWQLWHRRQAVAAMEWIINWCFFRGAYRKLAFHAAVAAPPGEGSQSILFPGNSGAGKSTLASTLMMSGWRLLSDEIGLCALADLRVTALGRPTILKGHSLDLIAERFGDKAVFGPTSPVLDPPMEIAHLRPTPASVEISGDRFDPVAIVFPRRQPKSEPRLEPVSQGKAFSLLCKYGINYRLLGMDGFRTTLDLVKRCPAYRLFYQEAAEAERFLRSSNLFGHSRSDGHANGSGDHGSNKVMEVNHSRSAVADQPRTEIGFNACKSSENDSPLTLKHRELLQMLIAGLRVPEVLTSLPLRHWDQLVVMANHTALLPRLAERLLRHLPCGSIPQPVRYRLAQALEVAEFNRKAIGFELLQLRRILAATGAKAVLLKGAAYQEAGYRWACGRHTNDVDLLVSEGDLALVQAALLDAGYVVDSKFSEADYRYFRRWLHELPPMKHTYRGVEVDVHFRLLPASDPKSFDAQPFIERSVSVPGSPFRVPDSVDQALHVLLNLGRTGEFLRAFRDLWDLCCMVEAGSWAEGSDATGFEWDELVQRSKQLGLGSTVGTMLLLASDLLRLHVPDGVCEVLVQRDAARVRRGWLYRMMTAAALPAGPALRSKNRRLALWAMEHYPLPRIRTWLDPLTWTKRVKFAKSD